MQASHNCAHCQIEANSRRRDFSDQAWTVLVLWEEIEQGAVQKPLCDDCYDELREILIDRSSEIEMALSATKSARKSRAKKLTKLAS